MTDAYNHVPKPSGTTYNRVGFQGKQSFDDPSVLYDDPSVFYDSVNESAWGIVAKPTGGTLVTAGTRTGLLMSLTYPERLFDDPYHHVAKPTT